jgi:hypothetical protein
MVSAVVDELPSAYLTCTTLRMHTSEKYHQKTLMYPALKKTLWLLVRKQTIPTERPPLVGEVSANFFADRGCRMVSATDPYGR